MNRFSYAAGAFPAIFVAGPIFIATLSVGQKLLYPQTNFFGEVSVAGLIGMTFATIGAGAILSGVPIIGGGHIMATLGQRYPVTRHPLFWAIAGALLGAAIPIPIFFGFIWQIEALFAATGAICALIVRYGTRWSDAPANF